MTRYVICIVLICLTVMVAPVAAKAYSPTPISGTVTLLEASYMPTQISFKLSAGDASCPSGKYLVWQNSSVENTKAVFSMLLSAKLAGASVLVHHTANNSTSCTISNVTLN